MSGKLSGKVVTPSKRPKRGRGNPPIPIIPVGPEFSTLKEVAECVADNDIVSVTNWGCHVLNLAMKQKQDNDTQEVKKKKQHLIDFIKVICVFCCFILCIYVYMYICITYMYIMYMYMYMYVMYLYCIILVFIMYVYLIALCMFSGPNFA